METSGGDEWWRRVVETSGGDEWWRRVVETSGGDEWWRRVVETSGGDGGETGSVAMKERQNNRQPVSVPSPLQG